MKGMSPALVRVYSLLLKFYPPGFRKRFGEEMLLDFSDRAADAREAGLLALLRFVLSEARDLPLSLLQMHLAEDIMAPNSGSKIARTMGRSALALGLALAVMQSATFLFSQVMQGQGWLFLLRIANSRGWAPDYNAAAQTLLSFTGLLFGSVLAAPVLALLFSQAGRIQKYVVATILCWAVPLTLLRIAGRLLQIKYPSTAGSIFSTAGSVILGLGFALLFRWILNVRKGTVLLLLAGVAGYYAASALVALLLPLFPESNAGIYDWRDFAVIAVLFGLQGGILGAILGAASEIPGPKTPSPAPV
ncbi:MAG: hypothetical protein ACM3QS_02820 [Bacteroidota bacterium]